MYEEYTYDAIMAEMLGDIPSGIDTSEGSLVYIACSRFALMAEEIIGMISDVNDNMECDTADLDHLITGGSECGCPIIEATAATVSAQFNCAVSSTDRFEAPEADLTYYVIDCTDAVNHIYTLGSEDPGTDANSYLGEIDPIDYIEGFESGVILSVITAGTAQENEEVYRQRREDYYGVREFASNKKFWITELDAMDVVGGCKPKRAATGGGNIAITIIGADYKAPTASVIAAVQQAADPLTKTAEGEGLAAIGAAVVISGCSTTTINITAHITFATGITYTDIQSAVEAAIDTYFVDLGKSWEDAETPLVVRISQIELRLLEVEGITDIENITINGTGANLTLAQDYLPVRGMITCS